MKIYCKTTLFLVLSTSFAVSLFAQRPKMPPVKVPCGKVVEVNNVNSRIYTGKIDAIGHVNIVPRVNGYIEKTCFKQGDFVKKGDPLYFIEDQNYKAILDANAAKVAQIETEIAYTQKQYERNTRLRKQNAVADTTLEESLRAYQYAKAKLLEAKANLKTAQINYSYTKIYSPISGYAGKSAVPDWNYITPSTGTLVSIVSSDPMYVIFAMSERDYFDLFSSREDLKKNGIISVQLPNGKMYPIQGSIYIIDNSVDADTGTLMIWGTIRNPDNVLTSGSLVNVVLSRKTTKKVAAVIPTALLTDANGSYVFVVVNGKAVRRDVKLGEYFNDLQLILSGLKPGELIVVDGTHKLRPGADVIPVQTDKGSAK